MELHRIKIYSDGQKLDKEYTDFPDCESKFVKGCESRVRGVYIKKDGTRVKDKCMWGKSWGIARQICVSLKWALGNLDWMLPNPCLQGEGWWEFHSLILFQIADSTIWCFLIFKIYFVCACAEGRGQFAGVNSFLPPCGGRISCLPGECLLQASWFENFLVNWGFMSLPLSGDGTLLSGLQS